MTTPENAQIQAALSAIDVAFRGSQDHTTSATYGTSLRLYPFSNEAIEIIRTVLQDRLKPEFTEDEIKDLAKTIAGHPRHSAWDFRTSDVIAFARALEQRIRG